MKKTLDVIIASLIAVCLIIFLIFLGTKSDLGFDPSCMLLSYQNLFEGKGFVYDYDGKYMPFDPAISTGPELYLPVFIIWKIIGHTDYYVSVYIVIALNSCFSPINDFRTTKMKRNSLNPNGKE